MSLDLTALGDFPLFADIPDSDLGSLLDRFEQREVAAGQVLFDKGDAPTELCVLLSGSVSVEDHEHELMTIRAPEMVGELSALTGECRVYRTTTTEPSTVLTLALEKLRTFLTQNGDTSLLLQRNMLRLAARKIGRDRRRQREMSENIINTQKAMKRMRAALLESEDNSLHSALFEQLDALIEQNRKAHYLVEPSRLVPTHIELQDHSQRRVTALSNEWLYFNEPPSTMSKGEDFEGVLILGQVGVPVSGRVEKVTRNEACVYLDELVETYEGQLTEHLDRARILDIVL